MEVSFSKSDIRAINKEALFSKYLYWDIIGQDEYGEQKDIEVFPSIGNKKITFYHKGIILFRYVCGIGFETHFQNTTVKHPNKIFITEQDISKENKLNNYSFVTDYGNIKRNASRVATDEKREISKLYSRFSCARRVRYHGIQKVLLDQEISIDNNRIDLALFDFSARGGKALRFYEVKMYDDPRIVRTKKTPPEVVNQIRKYKEAIRKKEERSLENIRNTWAL